MVDNFGNLPEEVAIDPKLATERLCDRCQDVILKDYPEHPSVPYIRQALARQLAKYTRPVVSIES